MADILIPIDTEKNGFDSFLEIEKNSRVFFSGKFGIGKTYFLNDFFGSLKEKYDVYHLFPINYQINSNEDILELIKYDILVELLNKNENVLQENIINGTKDSFLLFVSWIKNRFSVNSALQSIISAGESTAEVFLEPMSTTLSKLGRPLKDLLKLDSEFQEFKNEYKGGEKAVVEKCTQAIKAKSISETDYLSHLLKEKIVQQKNGKKSVLILDDLDRVDPDHVFRVLNVLSAFFEKEHENKFGFDVIIVVADYSNLKHFFHHKYGPETDFSGYMDKFFTVSPYYFDNKKAVLDTVEEIVKSIKNNEPNLNGAIGNGGYIKLFLWHIFSSAIDCEAMNLRSLLKATKFQLLELRKGGYYEDPFESSFQKIFDVAVKVAVHSFSNTEVLIKKIEIIKNSSLKSQERMPYDIYIITMLKSFGVKIPEEGSFNVSWGKYSISRDETGRRSIKVAGDQQEQLFYDLMINYLRNKKYLRTDYRNYED